MKAEDAQQFLYTAISVIRAENTKQAISTRPISDDPKKAYKEGIDAALLGLETLREKISSNSKSLKELGING